ncbi:hypothetical protein [Flavobacterium caeni]|uniref:Uncharacterized protein n=1 Tax=Flavobacterium caeni TaxID=490189 RepID=A0A1G5B051_9FLAO|nr:hypothetical protein [Flavobacterium caeni]SCX83529.1 hypothetical protein SAMN02927903_00209 [Flavobacterium caeni]
MIPLYFDPGTGALIVQFLAAAVAGVLLFYRTVVAKVKSIFGIKPKSQDGFADSIDTKEEADQ